MNGGGREAEESYDKGSNSKPGTDGQPELLARAMPSVPGATDNTARTLRLRDMPYKGPTGILPPGGG